MTPRFRADHVGSLLRPDALKGAFRAHATGELDDDGLRAAQDDAIQTVVALQEEVGLRSVTDGEMRRGSYWSHILDAVVGLSAAPAAFEFRDGADDVVTFTGIQNHGRLHRSRSISGDELDFLRAVTVETPKITMPAPSTTHFWRGPESIDRSVYPTLQEFLADVSAIFRDEIADLASRGLQYVQLDEVAAAMLCDGDVRDAVLVRGEDPDELLDLYIDSSNDALRDRPADMTAALHVCRGNYKGHWLATGGYEPIAEALFGLLAVDTFFLEFDSERAGGFAPLRFVPDGVGVVLGLVSTKSPELEHADDLVRRIEEASAFVPMERLGISPQCGFASTAGGNPLSEDDERRKLALVVEVAQRVWG